MSFRLGQVEIVTLKKEKKKTTNRRLRNNDITKCMKMESRGIFSEEAFPLKKKK